MKLLLISLSLILFSCTSKKKEEMEQKTFTYLALGDSYTIGEAVEESERWPVQLVDRLRKDEIDIKDAEIVATTGWTTDELQKGIIKAEIEDTYDLVSLLIGVNNQYRGYPIDQYKDEFKELLDQAVEFAGGNPKNVFVVSIPDYGVTPFAVERDLDQEKIAHELHEYNAIAEKISLLRDAHFINITEDSKLAANDTSLIASDGLHPSGKMYTSWVNQLYQQIYTNLSSR